MMALWNRGPKRADGELIRDNSSELSADAGYLLETVNPLAVLAKVEEALARELPSEAPSGGLPGALPTAAGELPRDPFSIQYLVAVVTEGRPREEWSSLVEALRTKATTEEHLAALKTRIDSLQEDISARSKVLDQARFHTHMAEEGVATGIPVAGSPEDLRGQLEGAVRLCSTLEENQRNLNATLNTTLKSLLASLNAQGPNATRVRSELELLCLAQAPAPAIRLSEAELPGAPELDDFFNVLSEEHGPIVRHSGDSAFTLTDDFGD